MDNFEEQIKSALADPDIMNKVSSVLSSLGQTNSSPEAQSAPSAQSAPAMQLPNLSSLVPNDDRTRLLLALKPFLSEKRAPYMDSAVNILKLVSVGKLGKDLKLF